MEGYTHPQVLLIIFKLFRLWTLFNNNLCVDEIGISAGIDLSFYFIKKQFGPEIANAVAAHMEYDWKDLDYGKCTCK